MPRHFSWYSDKRILPLSQEFCHNNFFHSARKNFLRKLGKINLKHFLEYIDYSFSPNTMPYLAQSFLLNLIFRTLFARNMKPLIRFNGVEPTASLKLVQHACSGWKWKNTARSLCKNSSVKLFLLLLKPKLHVRCRWHKDKHCFSRFMPCPS